jgi:AcrR family transcriptional regulator
VVQPSVYSREQIIDAAFQLLREEGWAAVSARSVAKKLGSSTMPIYSHLRSIDELEMELRAKARILLKSYQQSSYTEQVLLNLAIGYVAFARDEKLLFRFLYTDKPEGINLEDGNFMRESFLSEFGKDSAEGRELAAMKESGQEAVVRYAWIFTHGLAMIVNSGALEAVSDQLISGYLKNAGEAFYAWGISKGGDINGNNEQK